MGKIKLNHMIILMIGLATLLVINTMGILAYRDTVLSAETQKNSALNFMIKYDYLLDDLLSDAQLFILTNDENYRTSFIILKHEFTDKDNITLRHQTFTESQANSKIKNVISKNGFTLSSQAQSLNFSKYEESLYQQFLTVYHTTLNQLTHAVGQRDMNLISDVSFHENLKKQGHLTNAILKSYMDRLNLAEDNIVQFQQILDVLLIVLYLSFLGFCSLTFLVLVRENRHQSYFRQFYNTVIENVNVGIAVINQTGSYEYMNSMYKEILGITLLNTLGKRPREILPSGIIDETEVSLYNERDSGMTAVYVGSVLKKVSYDYFTIYLENGDKKIVYLIQDDTEAERLHDQLKKQLKEIEYFSKAKDRLMANISHEIKTPINAILGMVHFLKGTRLSENQKDLIRKIESSSDILLTIISDVLDLSRIKNSSLSLYPSDFSLGTILKNVEDMFSNQIAAKGLVLKTEYIFDPALNLHLDKTRFVQVLVNLLGNACKFTSNGYVKLRVEVLYDGPASVNLQVCVEDSGIGIAEHDMSKLFQEFEQMENLLTKQHQGTGLGLFISKSIIESMNGRMWAESVKDKGSKFFFIVPAEKAFHSASITLSNGFTSAIPIDGHGDRALVVEDTEINVEVAVKLLNDVNIVCDTAPDGLAAVQLCKKHGDNYYKVILMDIHMPVMDGYTAALILKNDFGYNTPIVALTASDIDSSIREKYQGVIDEFILKPFKVSAFYKSLAPYFDQVTEDDTDKVEGVTGSTIQNTVKVLKAIQENDLKSMSDEIIHPLSGKDEAIKNLGGLETIYYKHIKKFQNNYVNSPEHIKGLLDEGNYDEARRLAHSIKGLGGTLGMPDVQSAAASLEKAILMGKDYNLNVELEDFEEALLAAIDACADLGEGKN